MHNLSVERRVGLKHPFYPLVMLSSFFRVFVYRGIGLYTLGKVRSFQVVPNGKDPAFPKRNTRRGRNRRERTNALPRHDDDGRV